MEQPCDHEWKRQKVCTMLGACCYAWECETLSEVLEIPYPGICVASHYQDVCPKCGEQLPRQLDAEALALAEELIDAGYGV